VLSLSPAKLLIVFVVAVILVGPDKLPGVARQLGAAWNQLRKFHQRIEEEVRETVPDLPPTHEIARFARSPVSFLNSLADLHLNEEAVADPGVDGAADPSPDESWPADPDAPSVGSAGPVLDDGAHHNGNGSPAAAASPPHPPGDPSMN